MADFRVSLHPPCSLKNFPSAPGTPRVSRVTNKCLIRVRLKGPKTTEAV